MAIFKLKLGDVAEIEQEDGKLLLVRPYGTFTTIQAPTLGTTLQTEKDSHFIMAVKVVESQQQKMKKSIRVKVTDDVVEFIHKEFPDRIGNIVTLDLAGEAVLGIEIDIDGLTHGELMGAGMAYNEAVHLLGK